MADGSLRILQVMRAPVGGLFRHVADLTRELSSRGHQVGLVVDTLANDAQTESRLAALATHALLGIHRFAMPRLLGAGDMVTPFAVRKLARTLDIDVLHGHGAKGGFYARLARVGRRRPLALYTPHGGVLHFSSRSGSGRVFHGLERMLMLQTAAIIFESAYAQSTYSALIGAPTCPAQVIHNGLVEAEFDPVPPDADAADFVFVGELRDLKGVHILVDAMAGLRRADGQPVRIVMAGDGPARAELEAQIARLGLSGQIQLPGSQPARAMFARGRVAVVPSLAESLPYVVLEAIAAGLPLIATSVGGIPEIFGPDAEILVPAGNAEALRAAMQRALDDPNALAVTAARLRQRVSEHFSVKAMTDDIEALYRSALGKA